MLKKEVQVMFRDASSKSPLQKMKLIDVVQRLGLAYHFEDEIEKTLVSLYNDNAIMNLSIDLYAVALGFRLLRQGGYTVSPDALKKFKDENGEFMGNAKSIMCLYEAAHLRTEGEDILEEALQFSTKYLSSALGHLSSPMAEEVKQSLELPLHKCMPRLQSRCYISIYEAENVERNDVLFELAKLDYNHLQDLHKIELSSISRWWKDVDFTSKLSFARDRLVECYFWILGVYFEPKYSLIRIFMTKIIAIASAIDDIYDVYGTLEELQLFTDAIERWDKAAANDLPTYMQVCYLTLLDVMDEMKQKLNDDGGEAYRIYYSKEALKLLVRAYLVEAQWYNSSYMPTFEEYLGVSVMSSGYPMLAVQCILGMGEIATKEAFEWVMNMPDMVKSSALIARLVDDIHTYEVEQERGDAPSSVECYAKDYGVSEEEACNRIREMADAAWKHMNAQIQESKRGLIPLPLLQPPLSFARMMEVLYQDGDGYTNSSGRTKRRIEMLLVDPISI